MDDNSFHPLNLICEHRPSYKRRKGSKINWGKNTQRISNSHDLQLQLSDCKGFEIAKELQSSASYICS
jgi:hypothetical protein